MRNSEQITNHGLFSQNPRLIIPFIDVRVSAGFPSHGASLEKYDRILKKPNELKASTWHKNDVLLF